MEPALGLRVVRGPNWAWEDQDGGEGFVGTVAVLDKGGGGVIVQWDMGQRCRYRCGRDNKFDLRILDCAQIGIKHLSENCAGCGEVICGFLWRCVQCFECGALCSKCYTVGVHSTFHSFMRLNTEDGVRVMVRPREVSQQMHVSGIFPGALVVRGHDWNWKDQDGGAGNLGEVIEIRNWRAGSARSTVQVAWSGGQMKNYRLGHKGWVDLKCEKPAAGGICYPSHLPVLGGETGGGGGGLLAAGDQVRVVKDSESLKQLQQENWDDLMADFIGATGMIQHIAETGYLNVNYPGQATFPLNPEAVTKVDDVLVYSVGDTVRVREEKGHVCQEQKGHGDWRDDMEESLGQTGTVAKVLPSKDVQVTVGERRWVFNPSCLLPATPKEESSPQKGGGLSDLVRSSLAKLTGPDQLVAASAAGDIDTLTNFLTNNPEHVDAKVKGRTGLLVATAEGWPEIVKVLLEDFHASVDTPDENGDTALHYCAQLDRVEIAQLLLNHPADPNVCNQQGVFPLLYAVALGHYGMMRVLLGSGRVNHNLQERDGNTALHVAVAAHRIEAIKILLEATTSSMSVPNHSQITPIIAAAITGFYLGMEQFIRSHQEVVVSARDGDGNSVLHLAAANNYLDLVALIGEKGACDVNATNVTAKQTALHVAACEGNTRILEHLLLHCKADPDVTDGKGKTALQLVIANRQSIKTASEYSPRTRAISEELGKEDYVSTACLLATCGATFVKQDLIDNYACAVYFVNLLATYTDKASRS